MKIFTNEKYTKDELSLIESEHRNAYLKLFKSTLFVQALFPLLLGYIFYSLVPNTWIFTWVFALELITLIRGYLTYVWYKPNFSENKIRKFEVLSLLSALIAGGLWGITVFAIDFNHYPQTSVFLNIIIFGLAAGSVGIGSYWFEYFLTYNITVFSIYIVGFLIGIDQPYFLLAISLALFLMFMIQIALVFHRGNAQNIWLIKRNEKLAENLELRKKEAENLASSRTRFLASASHDLRQPLQALNFFLSALYRELNTDKGRELYSKLVQCAEGMNELLSAILDISKLDAQIVTLNREACNIKTILDNLKQRFLMQAEKKGLELVIHPSEHYIYTDAILLQRILNNLVSNAINYTKKGKVEILLTHKEGLLIEIIDTGDGLTELEQEQIFEEFYQLNNPERDKMKGLGLGLSIVKRLCQIMNAPIQLRSIKGEGSCFSIQLPLCDKPTTPSNNPQLSTKQFTENKKILVIDDDIAIRESLSELLNQWQFKVIAAESEDAACEIIEEKQFLPDLIIADYRLRENKTGVEAINKIKSHLKLEQLPAIIMSGDTEPRRLQEVAISKYKLLHKPVKPAHLRAMLQLQLIAPEPHFSD